jgi:plastocyanin
MRRPGPPELAIAAGAFVLLAASGVGALRGEGGGSASAPAGGTDVVIVDFDYEPTPLQASVGQPVRWTNRDSASHTVTSAETGPLDSGDLAEGESYDATFDEPGTYEYICTIHPTMMGTVEVAS